SVAKTLKVDLAQFRELEAFAQFATDLDEATKKQLERGKRSMELMKQPQYRPISFAKQSILIQLLNQGYLDQIDTKQIKNFEDKFLNYLDTAGSDLVKEIVEKKEITDEVKEEINKLADEFIKGFVAQTETKA
ncbi:F0F1 ATP synthase subunit alpha, partial [Patescibacteria group bacterium]|nr:F0F1 ATP synthase subunit alpha [Patescibacteria group bacterium]